MLDEIGAHFDVALRKESVDRNLFPIHLLWSGRPVALRKESVDRNSTFTTLSAVISVALRKESVDRNIVHAAQKCVAVGRSPQGERG